MAGAGAGAESIYRGGDVAGAIPCVIWRGLSDCSAVKLRNWLDEAWQLTDLRGCPVPGALDFQPDSPRSSRATLVWIWHRGLTGQRAMSIQPRWELLSRGVAFISPSRGYIRDVATIWCSPMSIRSNFHSDRCCRCPSRVFSLEWHHFQIVQTSRFTSL